MSESTKCPECKTELWVDSAEVFLVEYDGRFHTWERCLGLQLAAMTAELAEVRASEDALDAKVDALAPHGTCGCSYDKPSDLCLHHSPKLVAMTARAERAEAERDAAEAVSESFKDQLIEMRSAKKAADSLTGPPQAWIVVIRHTLDDLYLRQTAICRSRAAEWL